MEHLGCDQGCCYQWIENVGATRSQRLMYCTMKYPREHQMYHLVEAGYLKIARDIMHHVQWAHPPVKMTWNSVYTLPSGDDQQPVLLDNTEGQPFPPLRWGTCCEAEESHLAWR